MGTTMLYLLAAAVAIALVGAVAGAPIAKAGTSIGGSVTCANGAGVVGIWIAAASGGWASLQPR
jgi:hypothetical protein